MTDWADGYISDVSYTLQFHRQTTPAWLSMATLLAGHRPPRIGGKFRWCDLGCGQGFTALSVAACHPQAEVFAFDFNPAHIDNARNWAAQAGLGNVEFAETSFEALAQAPREALPQMDFIVLHGVWSWVSSTQRAHLVRFIRDRLAPGGIVYLSYNALAGWATMLPVQRLMRLWSENQASTGESAIAGAMGFVQALTRSDAAFFQHNPSVSARLEHLGQQNPHYLAHEFLHATWDPMAFDAVARDLEEAKCGFIGSATLLDNFDAFTLPPNIAATVAQSRDPRLQEVLRDFATAKTFRRDLFRRGTDKPLAGELADLLDEVVLTDLGRKAEESITLNIGANNSMTLKMDVYGPVLERLRAGPLALGELRRGGRDGSALREILSVLCAGGFAHPTPGPLPGAVPAAQALNRAIGAYNRHGGAFLFQVAPVLGSALPMEAYETMIMAEFMEGVPADLAPVAERLASILVARGLLPEANGETRAALRQTVEQFVATRVPVLRRVGILPG